MNGKFFIVLILVFVTEIGFAQQNVKQLFNEFSGIENASKTSLGKPGSKASGGIIDVKEIKSVEMLNLEECSKESKEHFANAVKKLKDTGYEMLMKLEQDGQHVRFLIKKQKDVVKEVVILSAGDTNVMIWIKGKIDVSELKMIQKKFSDGC